MKFHVNLHQIQAKKPIEQEYEGGSVIRTNQPATFPSCIFRDLSNTCHFIAKHLSALNKAEINYLKMYRKEWSLTGYLGKNTRSHSYVLYLGCEHLASFI